ncbi:neutral/alkaline non-lysosomal ceramidase N-terminal domain-containing protein, partial [bacterium]|nr:neutral/alkaline non-lysosomal ceramidase N-terminal domain-containing protein [bacterium]
MVSQENPPSDDMRECTPSRRRFLQGSLGAILAGSILTRLTGCASLKAVAGKPLGKEPAVAVGAALPYRIGAAEADITPTWPIELAGWSSRKHAKSKGAYQPLLVRAMTIDDGKNKIVYVMGDIITFGRSSDPDSIIGAIQAELSRRHGLAPDQVIFVASHTHSGPAVNDEKFKAILIAQTIKVVGEALTNAQPARLFFGRGCTNAGISRRGRDITGEDVWQINPYGTHDHEVVVLKAVGRNGRPIALTFNYGCHPSAMDLTMLGGDYAGFAQAELKKRLGVTALFLQGTAGDAKPDTPSPQNRFLFKDKLKTTIEETSGVGKRLADSVCKVLAAPMDEITGPIRCKSAVIELPVLSAWESGGRWIDKDSRLDPAKPLSGPRRRMARMAKYILASMDENGQYKVTQPADIYCVRIGDKFIHVGLSGEICAPIGLRIKDQLRGNNVMVTGYTGPMHGYVPGQGQITAGGYEVFTNPHRRPYSPELEDILVLDAMDLAESIGPKIPPVQQPR